VKEYTEVGGLYIGPPRGEDIKHWKGTVRVPLGIFWPTRGALRGLLTRLCEQGIPFRCREPYGLEVAAQYAGQDRIGHISEWQGFLWIGKAPKKGRSLCGARTRRGTPCEARCVEGKERCRLHGGLSTGAKTAEGRARIAQSNRRRAQIRRIATAFEETNPQSGAYDSL